MKQQEKDEKKRKLSKCAASGATAIIFLFIGFQAAIFVLKVLERPAVIVIPAETDTSAVKLTKSEMPATGHFRERGESFSPPSANGSRSTSTHHPQHRPAVRKTERKVESFPFDPNCVTLEELVRLGLTEKQAEAILNYREKGGKFRTKEDFKKMYTVSDSLYRRLERFIDIAKVDINSADSAKLTTLKGIGPYYAKKIISYRDALGGYYCKEQLLEIKGIDEERFEGFRESITVDTTKIKRFCMDTVSEESLSAHPYIGKVTAKAIVRLRKLEILSDSILVKESILESNQMERIKKYVDFEKK